jgi:hypothetical protein
MELKRIYLYDRFLFPDNKNENYQKYLTDAQYSLLKIAK